MFVEPTYPTCMHSGSAAKAVNANSEQRGLASGGRTIQNGPDGMTERERTPEQNAIGIVMRMTLNIGNALLPR